MAIKIKRVYEAVERTDGIRILVDRLWPRGISKATAQIDSWFKEIAPSGRLRKLFSHKPSRWQEFQRRYRGELRSNRQQKMIHRLKSLAGAGTVTLLFAAKDENHNNAKVLAAFLKGKLR